MFKFSQKSVIKIIDIQGVIASNKAYLNRSYKHYEVLKELHYAQMNNEIAGVILRINSPGGSAGASSELASVISDVRKEKPVYASISDYACSGAYLAASSSSKIFCSDMGIVGSIGVVMQIPNLVGISEKFGFSMMTIKSVEKKDIGNPFRGMTEEEYALLKKMVDEAHEQFVHLISVYRNQLSVDDIKKIADGRVFHADEAYKLCLIDKRGTFYDALDDMLKKLDLLENEFELEYSNEEGFVDKILSRFSLQSMISSQFGLFLK